MKSVDVSSPTASSSSVSLSMSDHHNNDKANTSTTTTTTSSTSSSNETSYKSTHPSEWTQTHVKAWLESIGMLPYQIKNAMNSVRSGKMLLAMSDSEIERTFALNNSMHRRKLRLAIDELKLMGDKATMTTMTVAGATTTSGAKYPRLGELSTEWIVGTWLKELGLMQYASVFKLNLVDGRLLASLQRKDLEKHFGMHKRYHQISLVSGVEFLRKYDFDINVTLTSYSYFRVFYKNF